MRIFSEILVPSEEAWTFATAVMSNVLFALPFDKIWHFYAPLQGSGVYCFAHVGLSIHRSVGLSVDQ